MQVANHKQKANGATAQAKICKIRYSYSQVHAHITDSAQTCVHTHRLAGAPEFMHPYEIPPQRRIGEIDRQLNKQLNAWPVWMGRTES